MSRVWLLGGTSWSILIHTMSRPSSIYNGVLTPNAVRRTPYAAQILVLTFVLLTLSGCVWLRLLHLRDQLRDFDAHFTTVTTDGGLVLNCLHPILLAEDMSWLVQGPPTQHREEPSIQWTWRFHREPLPGDPPDLAGRELDLMVDVVDKKVTAVSFPKPILKIVPAEVVVAMLRALGKAKIDTEKHLANATLESTTKASDIPVRSQLLAWFGQPHEVRTSTITNKIEAKKDATGKEVCPEVTQVLPVEILHYRYRLVSTEGVADEHQPLVTVSFVFGIGQLRPREFRANLSGNWVAIALPKK